MKSLSISILMAFVLAIAQAQQRPPQYTITALGTLEGQLAARGQNFPTYTVTNLGSLGGTSCCLVIELNNRGWVDSSSNLPGDQSFHPFLWIDGTMLDLGTLGGPNSSTGGMNEVGDVTVGGSDTGIPDPLGEDFCGYGTFQTCLSFLWHEGKRILIPTLGGNNNDVNTINNRGQVLAFAETAVPDPTCVAPQVLGIEALVWEPKNGEIHPLPPLQGDSASVGFWINEKGQVVGTSGICGDKSFTSALHAVVWQSGTVTDLGNLGGTTGNAAFWINQPGQVVGVSGLPGGATFHGFIWQNGVMNDLGTLAGDFSSLANSINDTGLVVGESCDINLNCRAVIWQNGVIADLNTLVPADSSLFLLFANAINSRGQIVGAALDESTGAVVPFLATPTLGVSEEQQQKKIILPESVRQLLQKRRGFVTYK